MKPDFGSYKAHGKVIFFHDLDDFLSCKLLTSSSWPSAPRDLRRDDVVGLSKRPLPHAALAASKISKLGNLLGFEK